MARRPRNYELENHMQDVVAGAASLELWQWALVRYAPGRLRRGRRVSVRMFGSKREAMLNAVPDEVLVKMRLMPDCVYA